MVSSLIIEAREHIQDLVAPYRYSDDALVRYLNTGVQLARTDRPDYFLAELTTPLTSYALNSTLAVDSQLEPLLVYFIAGSAELRDDEFAEDSRAMGLINMFRVLLVGKRK